MKRSRRPELMAFVVLTAGIVVGLCMVAYAFTLISYLP